MKREVIYVRVSTFDQSCERQIADLTEFIARAEYDVLDIHKETNSGTKTNPHPRNQVMTLVQARKIDAVLVGELGQWSRFTQDLLDTQNQLNRTCGINATESPTRALKIAPQRYFEFAFNIVSLSSDQMELRSIWLKKSKKKTSKHSMWTHPIQRQHIKKKAPTNTVGAFLRWHRRVAQS